MDGFEEAVEITVLPMTESRCEFSSRFHSDSKWIRSGFESKRRESPRIHNVFAQQYGFANFGRVVTVIHCETLSWVECANVGTLYNSAHLHLF